MHACGAVLPPFVNDTLCEAYQLNFPDALWDSPKMPTFMTTGTTDGFTPGSTLSIAEAIGLVGVGGQVVGRRPVPEVGVGDHADLLEQLERAVDGRDVDPARGLLDLGADLLRGGVIEPRHRLQDELTLRCHPVAAGPQLLVPPVHGHARGRYLPVHGLILVRPM
jgi:hypothetical protein